MLVSEYDENQNYHALRLDESLSLNELISGFYELTVKFNKDAKQKQEYENKLEEAEEEIKELEEALESEKEKSACHLDALGVAEQWKIGQNKEKDDKLEKASEKIRMIKKVVE
jgi:hypothetical protein